MYTLLYTQMRFPARVMNCQAFLFTALDGEVSRGPIDYRRDWSDDDEAQPRSVCRVRVFCDTADSCQLKLETRTLHRPIFDVFVYRPLLSPRQLVGKILPPELFRALIL